MTVFWLVFGFAGQTLFFMRFLVQWIASERQKKSVIPIAFWYFSIAGGVTLLTYAISRRDPVFITGQSFGLLVYLRNLRLIAREKHRANPDAKTRSPKALVAAIVAAAVVVLGGSYVWENDVKDRVVIRNFGVVEPGEIYRAGRQTPATMRKIHDRYGVRTIVDLGAFPRGSARDEEAQAVAEELGVERHRFDLLGDATGNPNIYVAALRLMADKANYPLLVQCGAGAQRTGLVVILYRHLVEGKSLEEAYPESFRYGHDPGDDWIMLTYLAEHLAEIKQAYNFGGWIPGYPIPPDAAEHQKAGAPAPSPAGEGG